MVDLLQGLPRKRRFPFKRVESHSFQQLAQGKVEIFGESFEDLQKTLLHAHAGLNAFNLRHKCCYYVTTVTTSTSNWLGSPAGRPTSCETRNCPARTAHRPRSEERRVGKECVSRCRAGGAP